MAMRCAQAVLSRLAVVGLEGVRGSWTAGLVMIRDVSGERRVALVPFGSARRATARDLGLGVVATAAVEEELVGVAAGSAMRPTALGVGVAGGGMLDFLMRLLGVDGASPSPSSTAAAPVAPAEVFLLRDFWTDGGGGAMVLLAGDASTWALRRADRRFDIVNGATIIGDEWRRRR